MTVKQRGMIILPICLLLFNAVEEVTEYILPRFFPDPYVRTGVLIFLFSVGFTVIGDFLAPRIAKFFDRGHKKTQKRAGLPGLFLFYVGIFTLIYILYFIIYTKSPKYLLPMNWRLLEDQIIYKDTDNEKK
jgi:hypothetical protein